MRKSKLKLITVGLLAFIFGFFPVWGGMTVAAGLALLLVAKGLYDGEAWARPAAVGLLAIPSITGAYFSGPVMFFALIGLVPYFSVLLWGQPGAGGAKTGWFFLFLVFGGEWEGGGVGKGGGVGGG
ncbi:MAG: hypothetical protein H8D34_00195, partial [Chloroflexi bacterium]|nr:hypothetical protein [Chloroflexota bacterium]